MCMHEQWWLHCTSQWGWQIPVKEHAYCVTETFKMTEYSNKSASNFALSLNIPLWKLFEWFRSLSLWATGDWQLHHHNAPTHACITPCADFFGGTSSHPGDSAPLQPRFGVLWLLAFPKTKINVEMEEISDSWWDSGKYDGAADGDWENCVRSHSAYKKCKRLLG